MSRRADPSVYSAVINTGGFVFVGVLPSGTEDSAKVCAIDTDPGSAIGAELDFDVFVFRALGDSAPALPVALEQQLYPLPIPERSIALAPVRFAHASA